MSFVEMFKNSPGLQKMFSKIEAQEHAWLKEWRKHRKLGNLKKRMPSKKKRKKYYQQVLKLNFHEK